MALTLRTEELADGRVYGYVLPNVFAFKKAGNLPQPVVALMDEYGKNKYKFLLEKTFTPEETEAWDGFRARVVAWMVREIDGEDATLKEDEINDPEQFPVDVAESLFLRALQLERVPKVQSYQQWQKEKES